MHPYRHSLPWETAFIARWARTEDQTDRAARVADSTAFADDAMTALDEARTGVPSKPAKKKTAAKKKAPRR